MQRYALTHAGDPDRGRELFRRDQVTRCLVCHRVDQKGGDVGPDLTHIGGKFDRPHLIEALLEPSRQIVEGYRSTVVVTQGGQTLTGIIRNRSDDAITLADLNGQARTVPRAEIAAMKDSNVSLMPAGLADELTPQQFTDLIAYLESLRPGGKAKFGAGVSGPVEVPDGYRIDVVATGIDGATALETLPDGRVLVCEQPGRVRVVKDDQLLETPLVTLPVDGSWERGVIGVTIDPGFPSEPYVYVCWVAKEPYPHHRISRFRVEGDVADPDSHQLLLRGDDQRTMGGNVPNGHQGGALHFGNDGCLYVGIGEQTAGEPAQSLDTFLGKILRINRDGSIPDDNPLLDRTTGKYQAIWALGCRNPFTFAIRKSDDLMLINDVGGKYEEINVGQPGANYGWPTVDHGPRESDEPFVGPLHWYPQASISGGDFTPDLQNVSPTLRHRYLFADFVHGWIHILDPQRPDEPQPFASGLRRPVDLRFAADGSLYVLLRNAWVVDGKFEPGTGSLLKITRESEKLSSAAQSASEANQSAPADSHQPHPKGPAEFVRLEEDATDPSAGGLPAYRIETPTATYYLEKQGGGLSSLVDRDGNDWLGFEPTPGRGSAGEYRGFPNAVHQQAGNHFHPLNQGTDRCRTRVLYRGTSRASIEATAESGKWQARYDFYPDSMTFTMTRMPAGFRYWVLYEGTPGGSYEDQDWCMTGAADSRHPMTEPHEGDLAGLEWIAFGDADTDVERSLVLLHHQDDPHPDRFYQMRHEMTVFGFGREGLTKYLDSVPQSFTVGLLESTQPEAIRRRVERWQSRVTWSPPLSQQAPRPHIELWYGDRQRFGHRGIPQRWVNVLGRVWPASQVESLRWRFADGPWRPLTVGPNRTRLANAGDFNVEIDHHELTCGDNEIELLAIGADGEETRRKVVIEWDPAPAPLPLHVRWNEADSIQDVAQVVDGRWRLTSGGVRTIEPYYDRVLALGDLSWTDYEVETSVTFHGMRMPGPKDGGRNVIHAAIATRWPGHDVDEHQPHVKWYPLGATSEFTITGFPDQCRWRILGGAGRDLHTRSDRVRPIELNQRYGMKHRVTSRTEGGTEYQVKLWPSDAAEPSGWDLVHRETEDEARGGALLLAHYADVTFGDVTVRSVSDVE